jgi:hypothetical protein
MNNDVLFPKINDYYHAICLYNGLNFKKCPNNINSICQTGLLELPRNLYHKWDGKNGWKCPCG